MTWVKLDASYFLDAKIERTSPHAELLFVRSLCHAKLHLTDGHISRRALRMIAPDGDHYEGDEHDMAAELEEAGLWIAEAGGWRIAAWLDHNPPADEIRAKREKDAERKRRDRSRPNSVRSDVHTDTDDTSTRTPDGRDARVRASEQSRAEQSISLSRATDTDADRPPPSLRERVQAALDVLAWRDVDRRGDDVIDREAYYVRCYGRRVARHAHELEALAAEHPHATNVELADLVAVADATAPIATITTGPCVCGWDPETSDVPHGVTHSEWVAGPDDRGVLEEQLTLPARPNLVALPGGAS